MSNPKPNPNLTFLARYLNHKFHRDLDLTGPKCNPKQGLHTKLHHNSSILTFFSVFVTVTLTDWPQMKGLSKDLMYATHIQSFITISQS